MSDGVFYDSELTEQQPGYYEWLQAEVMPRLGGADSLPCVKDKFGRPVEYTMDFDNAVLRVRRTYMSDNGSWAKKCDDYIFEGKEVANGN